MGIYYAAIDRNQNIIIHPPKAYASKAPGIYHPDNPFPHMVIMKAAHGYQLEIVPDEIYCRGIWTDITDEVYKEYLDIYGAEIARNI